MAFKFVVFAALIAVARAGGLGLVGSPALAYSSYSAAPVAYSGHIAKVAAPVAYTSPVAYAAPVAHAAPVAYASHAAPVAYASHAAPVAYAAHSAPLAYAAPVAKTIIAEQSAPAHYDYGYSVSDPHTGDQKSQHESRRGDVVQGSYSLVDADGTKRTVDYTADAYNGFNAVVHKEAPVVAKVVAPVPVSYAAPAVGYAAPVAYASHAAPAVSYSAPVVAKYAASPAVAYSSYHH